MTSREGKAAADGSMLEDELNDDQQPVRIVKPLVSEMTKFNLIFQVFAEMARAEMIDDELLESDVRFWKILLFFL